MKKIIVATLSLVFLFTGVAVIAKGEKAQGPKEEKVKKAGHWELVAPTGIDFTCGGGTYRHTLDEVTSNDPLMGYGHYNPNPAYTWALTGEINGHDVSFMIVYTGVNAGYKLNLTGTIAEDGSIVGKTDGNCQTFVMGEGSAVWKGPADHLYLYSKNPSTWEVVDGAWGKMMYQDDKFSFNGHGLEAGEDYSLVYYPDPWPGTGLMVLGEGTANKGGNVHINDKFDFELIPIGEDDNEGAKIWLVLSDDAEDGTGMTAWNPTEYLFENNLLE